jgi:hypothetical protein
MADSIPHLAPTQFPESTFPLITCPKIQAQILRTSEYTCGHWQTRLTECTFGQL